MASIPLKSALSLRARQTCGVPSTAAAVLLRFHATPASGSGKLFAFAADQPKPPGEVLGYSAATGFPATALSIVALHPVPCGTGPTCVDFTVQVEGTGTHLAVQVEGYFSPHASHHGQSWTGGASPALGVAGPDVRLQLRNSNDVLGGFLADSWSTAQFGLYNPSASDQGVVAAGSRRALVGAASDGRVGSMTNLVGQPAFRNLLDTGDAGDTGATITGDLDAASLGGASVHRVTQPVPSYASNTVVVNAPRAGFIVLTASASATFSGETFTIRDEADNYLTETAAICQDLPSVPCTAWLSWVVPTNAGVRTFRVVHIGPVAIDPYQGFVTEASLSAVFYARALGTAFAQQ
jgi:hypothetical protein